MKKIEFAKEHCCPAESTSLGVSTIWTHAYILQYDHVLITAFSLVLECYDVIEIIRVCILRT